MNKSAERRQLREFVNNVIEKDYALANANLTAVINNKIRKRAATILQENP